MHSRFISSLVLFGSVALVVAGGCGGDEEDAKPGGGGGKGGSTSDRGGSGGQTTRGGSDSGGESGMGSPEPTGSTCEVAADCYAGLDTSELSGDVACIDKVEDGYCTHECEEDSDCCAVEGECRTGFKQVCAPFENTDVKYCFLSCEDEDLVAAGGSGGASDIDANEYCEREAHPRFVCRSTGGGSENRLVCLPEGDAGGAGGGPNQGPPGGAGGTSGGAAGAAGAGGAGGASGGAGGAGGASGGAGGAGGATAGAGGA